MTVEGNCFTIHAKHSNIIFNQNENVLYYYDTTHGKLALANFVLRMVAKNVECFIKCQYEQAHYACRVKEMVGNPSDRDFRNMVHANILNNNAICTSDIDTAINIFGPNIPSIRWKTK